MFGYTRDAVRVKAKKCDGNEPPEYRKFSVDPQITSYEVLRSILAKAFDLRRDFTLSYRVIDDFGQETYLSLLSDWDLDAAFLSASEPCLCLQIDVLSGCVEREPVQEEEDDEEWEVPAGLPAGSLPPGAPSLGARPSLPLSMRLPLLHSARISATMRHAGFKQVAGASNIQGLLKSQMERTIGLVQRALQPRAEDLGEPCDPEPPELDPVGDSQFRGYLDPLGTLVQGEEMRDAVFHAGVDPALRKVVWKHLLNVYPEGLTGRERLEYMKRKAQEYQELKDNWRSELLEDQVVCQEIVAVSSMVRKDVLRTDRHLSFYAGSDDNQNVAALFNVLTTYALNHPSVSYCQGMSDLASPLLLTMQDEPSAYVCFCALMRRLQANFSLDGIAMGLKFQHLSTALLYYDPDFHRYLQNQQASDLLFCYRWLLLELKREFAFEEALRMLEVLWSSLPADCPGEELPLFQGPQPFKARLAASQGPSSGSTVAHGAARHSAYTRLCAMRRRDARRLSANKSLDERQLGQQQVTDGVRQHRRPFLSLDDSDLSTASELVSPAPAPLTPGTEKSPVTSPRIVRNLNEFRTFFSKQQVNGSRDGHDSSPESPESPPPQSSPGKQTNHCSTHKTERKLRTSTPKSPSKADYGSDDIFLWENPLQPSPAASPTKPPGNMTSSCEEALENSRNIPNSSKEKESEVQSIQPWFLEQQEVLYSQPLSGVRLPPPAEFGGGNPFLILLCVTLLRQHRDIIMRSRMDYNELAMHLDRMVRRHNVRRVLREARALYRDYLALFGSKAKATALRHQSS